MKNLKLLYKRYDNEQRIQELGKAIVFSNSERNEFGCPRRWFYSYSDCLTTETTSNAIKWGSYFHEVMEKIFRYWRDKDDHLPSDLEAFIQPELTNIHDDIISRGLDPLPVLNDILNALKGWVKTYGTKPKDFKVLEVEFPMICPVLNIDETIYRGDIVLIQEGNELRIARQGEGHNKNALLYKDFQWFVIGRCDALIEMRDTKDIYVMDHKTTGSITRYESMVEIDPQLVSYSAMLMYEKEYGKLQKYKDRDIGGLIYNLVCNKEQKIPKTLKNKELSKAKVKTIPSWLYKKTLKENNLKIENYSEHIQWIQDNADSSFYKMITLPVTSDKIRRWQYESLGIAKLLNQKHIEIAYADNKNIIDAIVPRIPVCRMTGYCNYKDICFNDNPISRFSFKQEPRLKWEIE